MSCRICRQPAEPAGSTDAITSISRGIFSRTAFYLWTESAALFLGFLVNGLAIAGRQEDRLAYIEYVKSDGIFELIEVSDNVAWLFVYPKFYESDLRSQAHVTQAVFEYMSRLPGGYTVVQIYDSETGKQIGIITPAGLRLF